MHPQLRLAVEHRFLLDQLLDLRQQGSAVAHRRLAQHLFGGGQCQLHQPRSDHAVERVQRVLEFGDQLLPVGGQRLLLLLRFQQPLLAAFLQSGLKTGLIAFLLAVGIAQLLALLLRLQAQRRQLLLQFGLCVRRRIVKLEIRQLRQFDSRFLFAQVVERPGLPGQGVNAIRHRCPRRRR